MKTISLLHILLAIFTFSVNAQNSDTEDWISLFNGVDLEGWTIKITDSELGVNLNETFIVEDSMLRIRYNKYKSFNNNFGHLYYHTPFSYYKLSFDYRFVGEQLTGGASWNVRNSGIMLHSQSAESNEFGQHFPVSIELQLLGGLDQGERSTANVCTPGTAVETNGMVNYDHCINSKSKTYNGDQWVHCEAIVMGGDYMTFIVEGDTVLHFKKPQIGGGFISNKEGAVDWNNYGVERDEELWMAKDGEILTEGYIALQAESHPIDFKNIKLLNLCGCKDPKAKNYKSYFITNDQSKCKY
ncbi:DUF1080 domain-containing protein [uncultured Draconibacterium sp.]|uniref:3-keto-disaccharide hydrolase n=1 Tax=uncultured Draconibacterium sp. TaxID=1573823 RepID=UPI003216CB52